MRKALLYIKVVLLLSAFAAMGSSHASSLESQSFIEASTSDFNAIVGEHNYGNDDKTVFTETILFFDAVQVSRPFLYHSLIQKKSATSKPFARAPPASTV
jgi:hypothetical protein